ncbi:PHD finger protein 11 [Spea bombifrons]|uniref:PHD finger protein 11 n=1 Tax=Spea bombifrons TaxID=233779 RepID=UPI002348FCD5|nr:PHD finger protein 11 [Spea bombifrons]
MLGVPRLPAPSPASPGNNRALGECMFCHDREQNADTGQLLKIPDDSVIAHYYCMLYAPLVVTKNPPDPSVLSGFDVESVKKEISRGEITRCCVCKKKGGIVGCDVQTCKRTYHYLCVKRANGHYVLDEENEIYKVFCSEHGKKKSSKSKVQVERDKDSDDPESSEESVKTPDRPFTKRKKRDGQTNSARKKKKKRDKYRDEFDEYSDSGDLTEPIHTPTFSIEAQDFSGWNSETDDELVPFDGSNITPKQKESKIIASLSSVHLLEEIARSPNACESNSSSEQGDSFFNPLPKVLHSTSLSRTWAKESAKETESVQCITSEEENVHIEMYNEFGGSLKFQDTSFEDENKSMEDTDIGDNYSSSKEDSFSKEDTSVKQPATSVSASMSPGVPQNPISELPSSPDTLNVVLPESTKSPVLQHTPILKPTDTCEIKKASDAQPKGYRNVRVNLSTKFTSFTQQPASSLGGNRALDLRSALPPEVKSSSGTQYTNPSAGIPVAKPTKSDHLDSKRSP